MTPSWPELPIGRVVYLRGASAEAVELSLEPLPPNAPAVVTYHPAAHRRPAELVESMLAELQRVAAQLFPAWLPAAEHIEGTGGGGLAALRALALEHAAQSNHFGPFIADLAAYAALGGGLGTARFAREVRAAELAKVIAASYQRDHAAILVDVPDGLDEDARRVLGSACEWFAGHGGFGVWLTGAAGTIPPADAGDPSRMDDRIKTIAFRLPDHVANIVAELAMQPTLPEQRPGAITYPPVAGRPRPDSAAEMALEAALARVAWASGRVWNRAYPQRPNYIVDLMWAAERCAVEIDGDDHRRPVKFANDRRRDVHLQVDGFAVLRFTNRQVLDEIEDVLAQIKMYIHGKRTDTQKG